MSKKQTKQSRKTKRRKESQAARGVQERYAIKRRVRIIPDEVRAIGLASEMGLFVGSLMRRGLPR